MSPDLRRQADEADQRPPATKETPKPVKKTSTATTSGPHRSTPRWPAFLVAVLVAGVIGAAGGYLALTRTQVWTVETQLLVGPGNTVDAADLTAYYETLSRGQVTATAAAIVGEPRFKDQAVEELPGTHEGVSIRANVVPGTALIKVSVSASSPEVAASVTDAVIDESTPVVNDLLAPYAMTRLGPSTDRAALTGVTLGQYIIGTGIALLVAAVGIYYGIRSLQRARRERMPRRQPEAS